MQALDRMRLQVDQSRINLFAFDEQESHGNYDGQQQ